MDKTYYFFTSEYPQFNQVIETKFATPVCGEDFCDACGDCLSCYSGDECYGNDSGEHSWIEYVSLPEGAIMTEPLKKGDILECWCSVCHDTTPHRFGGWPPLVCVRCEQAKLDQQQKEGQK